ncbi:ATP-binding protein [Microvirga sp. VF16]|uniref:ATP-binding protein n=1 Tax=Microvirga sp. VF16 TaxID=2807101 RepID=UPI00193E0E66|nr:ATP-binding protein [Microvirga sp. VF16]QRM35377.1 GAF domain-containing protein [Microvirga sp. VF16]
MRPNSIRNWLVGWVARLPARVQTKLLAAFLSIVGLLIVLGAVGLQVLSGVNEQTDVLIRQQRKIAAYHQVQHDTTSQLYSISTALLLQEDRMLDAALRQLRQFGYDLDRMEFIARDEAELLAQVRQDYDRLTAEVTRVVDFIRTGQRDEARTTQLAQIMPLADRLERLTNQLVNIAEADMVDAIETTERAYATSRAVVISFVIGSILLALGLGYIISWSLIEPVKEIETHLSQIAAGDFAQKVTIANRDELGALAQNVNRTSEQLGQLYRQIEARTHELTEALTYQTATGEVLKAISRSTLHLQPVLDTLLETAARLCRANRALLFRLDNGLYRLRASYGFSDEFKQFLENNPISPDAIGTIVGRTTTERRVLHYEDIETDHRYMWKEAQAFGGFRTVLGVPLLRDGEPIGAIVLSRLYVEPFTDKQIDLITVFADQAVIAIENARLVRELKEQSAALAASVEELKALAETGQAVSGTLDLTQVLDLVSSRAMALGQADACGLFRYDRTNRAFVLWRASGLDEDFSERVRHIRILEVETAMGRAIQQHVPVAVSDIMKLPNWPLRDAAVGAGIRSVLVVPLVRAERVFGTLVLMRREQAEFPRRTVDLMQTFANQSVLAIQNARLFREIEDKSRQLEIASQHKSQFLANMSHELRTPLNAVLGYTEMLLDGVYGDVTGEAHEILEYIQANGQHLLALINDVLDLSKIEAGQLALALDEYAVQGVIEAVASVAQPLAQTKGLDLKVDIAGDLPLGRGDERRLTQALLNLVGNAIKFTDAGSVTIAATAVGDLLELAVTDTGPGIAPTDQERIFDAFQQVDNSSTRQKGGTGLGLAISRRIVEMHGGTISVESTLGQGSTFRIRIPLQAGGVMEAA